MIFTHTYTGQLKYSGYHNLLDPFPFSLAYALLHSFFASIIFPFLVPMVSLQRGGLVLSSRMRTISVGPRIAKISANLKNHRLPQCLPPPPLLLTCMMYAYIAHFHIFIQCILCPYSGAALEPLLLFFSLDSVPFCSCCSITTCCSTSDIITSPFCHFLHLCPWFQ